MRGKSLLELEYDASLCGGQQWRSSSSMYYTVKQRTRIAFEAHRRAIEAQKKVLPNLMFISQRCVSAINCDDKSCFKYIIWSNINV